MQIRPARMIETPELVGILVERHPETIYAAHGVDIDEPLARKIIAHHIQRSDGTNDGGTFVRVAVDEATHAGAGEPADPEWVRDAEALTATEVYRLLGLPLVVTPRGCDAWITRRCI